MRKMRKYLRRADTLYTKQLQVDWPGLLRQAVAAAEKAQDPRAKYLRNGSSTPERTLRRIGIISMVDVQREFRAHDASALTD